MNIRAFLKAAEVGLRKNSPQILVGIGIVGMAASVFLMADARPKALEIIDREERKKGSRLTKKETVKATWKCYIPVALAWTTSAACIASGVNIRKERWNKTTLRTFAESYRNHFATTPDGVQLTYHPVYLVTRKR